MAKIKYYKKTIKIPKTEKVDSIVGKDYNDNYEERLHESRKMAIEGHKTRIKSKDIVLLGETKQKTDDIY